jgi:cobalt-zinc-cadmium efflux system outer membrane protein
VKTTVLVVAMILYCCSPTLGQQAPASEGVTLSQAIALALTCEPAARAAIADVAVARGMSEQANLRANPTISVERREEPGGTDSATDLSIEWPLELFRRRPRVAVANAEVNVAEHEAADVRRHLAGDVAVAYGEVAAAVRELAIIDEVLAAATKQLELLRGRVTQGATPALDRDMVDVEVRKIQAERLMQVGRSDRALIRLKRLLGMPPEAQLRVSQSLEELAAALGANGAPSAARPDVLASEARVRAEELRVLAARAESRPEITLFGSYMRMGTGFPQQGFAASGELEPVRGQFNYLAAGAMVTLPLWNRQQGSIAAAAAARAGADARLEATRLTAASEIAEARVRDEQARSALSLHDSGIRPLARRNLDTVRETYQLGRATIFEVLAEQRRFLEAERAYTEALSEAYVSRVSLSRVTGDLR